MTQSTAAPAGWFGVEVAFALPDNQRIVAIQVPPGTTMTEAVARSGIDRYFPATDLSACGMGIFSRLEKSPSTRVLHPGDRVELYRPLTIDPKEARRARVARLRSDRNIAGK